MKLVVVLVAVFAAANATSYYTIKDNLKGYFKNDYPGAKSEWSGLTYTTLSMPHYDVGCSAIISNIAAPSEKKMTIAEFHNIDKMYTLPMGPIGFAVNGVAIYNAISAENEDAYVNEGRTFDSCGAHTDGKSNYHYHANPGGICPSSQGSATCFPQIKLYESNKGTVFLVGVAVDGFPIFVSIDSSNEVATEDNLDDCGGKKYDTKDGKEYYAYFMSNKFPYTIGCLRGQGATGTNAVTTSKRECGGRGLNDWPTYICYYFKRQIVDGECAANDASCDSLNCYTSADATRRSCLTWTPTDAVDASTWDVEYTDIPV